MDLVQSQIINKKLQRIAKILKHDMKTTFYAINPQILQLCKKHQGQSSH